MNEEWRDINRYEGHYQVSNLGRVKSVKFKRHRILKAGKGRGGHLNLSLYKNNDKGTTRTVHRLVLEAFRGAAPKGCECSHLDGNPSNNKLSNLVWETHKENMSRKIEHDTSTKGSRSGTAVLNEEKVRAIKVSLTNGVKGLVIAKQWGVSPDTVSLIKNGKTWKHV